MTDWKQEHDAELGLRKEWSERAQKAEAENILLRQWHLEALRLSHAWMVKHDALLGFVQARPAVLEELIEQTLTAEHTAKQEN